MTDTQITFDFLIETFSILMGSQEYEDAERFQKKK